MWIRVFEQVPIIPQWFTHKSNTNNIPQIKTSKWRKKIFFQINCLLPFVNRILKPLWMFFKSLLYFSLYESEPLSQATAGSIYYFLFFFARASSNEIRFEGPMIWVMRLRNYKRNFGCSITSHLHIPCMKT